MNVHSTARRVDKNKPVPGPDGKHLVPAPGHYEDLLAWQGRIIQQQSNVIDDLTGLVRRLSGGAGDHVVDAEVSY